MFGSFDSETTYFSYKSYSETRFMNPYDLLTTVSHKNYVKLKKKKKKKARHVE